MRVIICDTKESCGQMAAKEGSNCIREAIKKRDRADIILATGVSQFDMLAELIKTPGLDWGKVAGFHLDEYAGMPAEHPASFRRYLKERFVSHVPLKEFHYIDGEGSPETELRRLKDILASRRIDVAFVGIGENGHLAFNDPPADFDTEEPYIMVDLDEDCRRQQLGEGWFQRIEEVPQKAISMSIRQIMKSRAIICTVPERRKARALKNCVEGPVSPLAPASILQKHDGATIVLDPYSSGLLQGRYQGS